MSVLLIPSARQPVTEVDPNGRVSFTRPWFLFFQALFERVGGALGPATDELVDSFVDSSNPETDAAIYLLANEIRTQPAVQPQIPPEPDASPTLAGMQDEIAELKKSIQALQQQMSL